MQKDVNACDCTWGSMDSVKESVLTADWEKNPLPHQGIEPALAACQPDAVPTELHPHPITIPNTVNTIIYEAQGSMLGRLPHAGL